MQRERALFLTQAKAYLNARAAAIRNGCSLDRSRTDVRVYPQRKRGEVVGYEAWYPENGVLVPVLEV